MIRAYDLGMSWKWCLAFVLSVPFAYACGCIEGSVRAKKDYSDVIFRGTIIELRDSTIDHSSPLFEDTKKIAVFRVSRVWKGDVGETFEMPAVKETSACTGFWPSYLKVGSDLLVYAKRQGSDYYTAICGLHKPAKDAKDLEELGPGEDPKSK